MASQPQRVRRNISPKQRPLKATIPISLMQQNASYSPSNIRKNSPTKSPIFLSRTEIPKFINRQSPEERLFSSYQNKVPDCGGIRRAASLDALAQPVVDHSTQTPEEWDDAKIPMKVLPEQLEKKFIRQRLRSGHRGTTLQRTSPIPADHSAIRLTPRSLLRSSIEGLNQEIEKLVLKGFSGMEGEMDFEKIPDGHRAPVLELATPSSTGSSRSHSLSPLVHSDWYLLSSGGEEGGASPEPAHKLGTSPHINTFLAREPPDGCERVKILEEPHRAPDCGISSHPRLSSFILLPSQSSAFIPLPRDFPRP